MRDHLTRCHTAEHEIIIRSGDRLLKNFLTGLQIPYSFMHPDKVYWGDQANLVRDHHLLTECDHVMVFHQKGSTVTSWWVKHLDRWWKQKIWGDKLHVIEKGRTG